MKIKFILILMILANMLQGQTIKSLTEDFYWIDNDTRSIVKFKFEENGKFELIIDSRDDCTSDYIKYGKGNYKIINDSIQIFFDSISTLKSTSKIDSIENVDNIVNLQIKVKDQHGMKLNDLNLSWGKPKKRWGWTTTKFFDKDFNKETQLELRVNKELNYLRVEKKGYYWCIVKLPKRPNKDYSIEVVLRPKPKVRSFQYFSNEENKLRIISECEIQFDENIILKKESCH